MEIMIFGEPTDNEILVGSKGLLELDISFNEHITVES